MSSFAGFRYCSLMKKRGVGCVRWLFVAALVVGCEKEDEIVGSDGGVDAGCPDYVPNDAGLVRLMRGCPLTIDYAIR